MVKILELEADREPPQELSEGHVPDPKPDDMTENQPLTFQNAAERILFEITYPPSNSLPAHALTLQSSMHLIGGGAGKLLFRDNARKALVIWTLLASGDLHHPTASIVEEEILCHVPETIGIENVHIGSLKLDDNGFRVLVASGSYIGAADIGFGGNIRCGWCTEHQYSYVDWVQIDNLYVGLPQSLSCTGNGARLDSIINSNMWGSDAQCSERRVRFAEYYLYDPESGEDLLTILKDYVTRMKDDQQDIYYSRTEKKAMKNSPFINKLKKKGYEVLYITWVDQYVLFHLEEFEGKKLVDTAMEDEQMWKVLKKKFEGLCNFFKDVLCERVERVVVSDRLGDSTCCVITAKTEKIMRAQQLSSPSLLGYVTKLTMEINPVSPVMKKLRKRAEANRNDKFVKDTVILLFETTLLTSGFTLDDPDSFSRRIHRMLKLGLNIVQDRTPEADGWPEQYGGGRLSHWEVVA
ncbi:heat shock protein 90-2 [Panicum miliaceum]|uniref:Heat shock protein 90-2 n=1 Tax=Panicum miliaceum TaxID=4540 RepID=A0A3L6QAT1_PANMI|nr:heat shock protein 90-2 [Panicum miliaceum]